MSDIAGGKVVIRFEGNDVNLSALLSKINAGMTATQRASQELAQSYVQVEAAQRKAELTILRNAEAYARSQSAAGNYNNAILALGNAHQHLTQGSELAFRAEAKLQDIVNQQSRSMQTAAVAAERLAKAQADANRVGGAGAGNSASAIQNGTNAVLGQISAVGRLTAGYFALQQIASVVTDTIAAGNQLEKTQALTQALAGSTSRYAEVVSLAKAKQDQFGGSLQENLDALSGFVNLSNRTGVSLSGLENIARRLAIVDPVQG